MQLIGAVRVFQQDEVIIRQAVKAQLGAESVEIGRKGLGFDQEFVPLLIRAKETDHQEVKVGCQAIHGHHFFCLGPNDPGQ